MLSFAKRHLSAKALVAAILGVAATIAIAWYPIVWPTFDTSWAGYACPSTPYTTISKTSNSVSICQNCLAPCCPDLSVQSLTYDQFRALVPHSSRFYRGEGVPESSSPYIEYYAGRPFLALRYSCSGELDLQSLDPRSFVGPTPIPISTVNAAYPDTLLPLMPVWPGFLLNAFFYSAIALLLLHTPALLRSVHRRRRGKCPACGYPYGKSPLCTECGSSLPRRAVA